MSEKFYIAVNGQQAGPFTIEELKGKNIQRDTLVWTEGLDSWTKAENIPMLKEILRATPPPLPNTEVKTTSQQTSPPPIPTPPQFNDKYFGYELARRRERLFARIIEAIIISVPILLLFGRNLSDRNPYSFGSIVGGTIFSAILGAIFYSLWGGNLGHKIMGLQVISKENGEIQRNAKTGALRETLKYLFSFVFIPVVWLLWDDNKQNLYDKVVKTYVVRKSRSGNKFFRGCFLFVLTVFFVVFLLIWGSIYFYINGVSALSNYVAERIPTSVDKEVGRELRREILRSVPIDEEKTRLLSEFYAALGYNTKTKVYVVKEDEFNAFALPDNSIFVFDHVLREVESYPELAALLAHEYIHIKNRHGIKTLANSLSRELLTALLTGDDNSETLISNSNKLLTLKNSRYFEIEADKGALELLEQKRIDINGMAELFKRMEKLYEATDNSVPSYLSTHPDIEDRLEMIEEEIKKKQNNYINSEKLDELFQRLTTFNDGYYLYE
ncbi:MAG: M48 family metalloprotease [Chitinophagales bacterium]|nr:M48 family metalloprotease [Chitinophagales bacterium]MDW8419773.1 M48 family metalloprotease [Chitinophagales bacterium]